MKLIGMLVGIGGSLSLLTGEGMLGLLLIVIGGCLILLSPKLEKAMAEVKGDEKATPTTSAPRRLKMK